MLNAIVSVYNKNRADYLGHILQEKGFNIFASHGTFEYFRDKGIEACPVESITDNPFGFENYVSSLGFKSLMGVLDDGNMPIDLLRKSINLVVYNFVPTWEIIRTRKEFNIHNVDLGGPTMVRAAAINYKNVLPIIRPEQYELIETFEQLDEEKRWGLARTALEYCSSYDNKLVEFMQYLK